MKLKSTFSYDAWVGEQAANILIQIRPLALGGRFNAAVYAFESKGEQAGYLSVCEEQPEGACDCIRFGLHGSNIMNVPASALYSLLWQGCRRVPICPTVEA
jgi:hypothetical protein